MCPELGRHPNFRRWKKILNKCHLNPIVLSTAVSIDFVYQDSIYQTHFVLKKFSRHSAYFPFEKTLQRF